MSRRPLVAGNWKMHGSRTENASLVEAIVSSHGLGDADCVVCPPFVYLADVARMLRDSTVALGAQDVGAEAQGAFTGEVSAAMLRDVGCTMAIVGHSERRTLYGENDPLVARKFAAAQSRGLTPLLCVGETLAEREASLTHAVVARQLDAVMDLAGVAAFGAAVIAYEPVWAIGTGHNATPAEAEDVHAFIRARIRGRDAKIAGEVRILYGGSVKAGNAAELFSQPDVDGGLIGGASLKADEFLAIVAAAGRGA
ncbi:MAG: triose-phosphate isomerase [Steroidobacteraceae bacterium]